MQAKSCTQLTYACTHLTFVWAIGLVYKDAAIHPASAVQKQRHTNLETLHTVPTLELK